MNLNYRNIIIILYTLEIQKYILIEDLLISKTEAWVDLIGLVFIVKDNKSFYFDSFGGQPDKFLSNQLSKPIIYHNYKIQDINSRLCGSYCLYFFYLIERMNYYDTILKMYFNDFK